MKIINEAMKLKVFLITLMYLILFTFLIRAEENGVTTHDWNKIFQSFDNLPVQDLGMIRSAYSVFKIRLANIYGKSNYNNMSPNYVMMKIIANPDFRQSAPIIKLIHPYLTKTFQKKYISLNDYETTSIIKLVNNFYQNPKVDLMKPFTELETKISLLIETENDFAIIPRKQEWLSPPQYFNMMKDGNIEGLSYDLPIIQNWKKLINAVKNDDINLAKKIAEELVQAVYNSSEKQNIFLPNLKFQTIYEKKNIFFLSAYLYLISSILLISSVTFHKRKIRIFGLIFLFIGLLLHLVGIVLRWKISGHIPLSNMYESFIFTTVGLILFGILIEIKNKTQLISIVCSIIGFIFMIIAHKLPIFNSKISPIMPALQSSWLTYHVVTIMLSYSAFALSFIISLVYIFKDILGKNRLISNPKISSLENIEELNHKVILFGFPLLTLGIITGAFWANIAWGRPWAFDPKETWSAITWIIYAIYIHTRFLRSWKGRKSILLSIIGFAAVLFTYIGVNFLLPSIHSYV